MHKERVGLREGHLAVHVSGWICIASVEGKVDQLLAVVEAEREATARPDELRSGHALIEGERRLELVVRSFERLDVGLDLAGIGVHRLEAVGKLVPQAGEADRLIGWQGERAATEDEDDLLGSNDDGRIGIGPIALGRCREYSKTARNSRQSCRRKQTSQRQSERVQTVYCSVMAPTCSRIAAWSGVTVLSSKRRNGP